MALHSTTAHTQPHETPTTARMALVSVIMDPADNAKLVTPRDAATLVDRKPRTIYGWIRNGWVDCRTLASGRMMVVVDSLWYRREKETAA